MKPAAPLHLAPLLLAFVAGGALGAGCRSGEAPPPVYVDAPPPPGAGVRGKPVVVEAESTFAAPHSGRLAEAVRVTYYRLEGEDYSGHGYGFSDDTGQPHLGPLVLPAFEFEVRLADLNFDGWADLWVSGRRDQRVHASDVWLYVPSDSVLMERGDIRRHRAWSGYVYSTALSDLPNLAVDTTQHRLLAGISNCGCAGSCFYQDAYAWEGDRLVVVARMEQDCLAYTLRYRVFRREGGRLRAVIDRTDSTITDEEYRRRWSWWGGDLLH